ncbi:MAG: sigma-70 family RNA polymerase sigma factor [Pseudomonadota bacterium]
MTDYADQIARCAAGDEQALRAIMQAEGGRMLGVALRLLRRRDRAEDAVQDTLVTIWRRATQFDGTRGSAKGWIYTILRNRCLTMLRDDGRETATEAGELERRLDSAALEEAFARLDHRSDLRRCLEALDTEKRASVLMSYLFGYTHGEIAGRLDVPLGTAKAWVRRGLSALRECLA